MTLNQLDFFQNTDTGATFSECRQYRYTLWRQWADGPTLLAIMLNPSTADELTNDPTVQRLQTRSQQLGYGRLVVCNLFAFRATNPEEMKAQADPIGPENNWHIKDQARFSAQSVFVGWGTHGHHMKRGAEIHALLDHYKITAYCLGTTRCGQPKHPLYIGYDKEMEIYRPGVVKP